MSAPVEGSSGYRCAQFKVMELDSMKPITGLVVAAMTIAVASGHQATKQEQPEAQSATLAGTFPKGDPIDKSHFSSGSAFVYWIMRPESVYNTQLASVIYEPGTRTRWHYHPAGQILIVTSGTAYYQEKGKPKQTFSKGDVAKCPPGVHHWHGSSPGGPVTLMAINPNMQMGGVVWLDRVTDEEYAK